MKMKELPGTTAERCEKSADQIRIYLLLVDCIDIVLVWNGLLEQSERLFLNKNAVGYANKKEHTYLRIFGEA